ncbi:MAG: hypothetical protein HYX76_09180 [Acidobacteria bacterium]|nr:hypothetical protein [Acidobacteriota bacterium]
MEIQASKPVTEGPGVSARAVSSMDALPLPLWLILGVVAALLLAFLHGGLTSVLYRSLGRAPVYPLSPWHLQHPIVRHVSACGNLLPRAFDPRAEMVVSVVLLALAATCVFGFSYTGQTAWKTLALLVVTARLADVGGMMVALVIRARGMPLWGPRGLVAFERFLDQTAVSARNHEVIAADLFGISRTFVLLPAALIAFALLAALLAKQSHTRVGGVRVATALTFLHLILTVGLAFVDLFRNLEPGGADCL